MGRTPDDKSNEIEQEIQKKGDSFNASENSDMIEILKRLQQQMTYLERKVDHLTKILEKKQDREPFHSPFSEKGKRSYHGPSERKFSRGYSRDDDKRPGGYHKEKDASSGKPFSKPYGKKIRDKKKKYSAKKSTGNYKGERVKKNV